MKKPATFCSTTSSGNLSNSAGTNGTSAAPPSTATLRAPEFAATNNLYSIAARAIGMRRVPFDARSVAVLGGAALVPFVPAELLRLPLDVVMKKVAGFFI